MAATTRDLDPGIVEIKAYPASFPVYPEGSVSIGVMAEPYTDNLRNEVVKWDGAATERQARSANNHSLSGGIKCI